MESIFNFGAVPALLIIFIRGKYLTESPIWLANQGDLKGQLKFYKNPMQLRSRYS